jgi:hypothetical protein
LEKVSDPFLDEAVIGCVDVAALVLEAEETKVVVSCTRVEPQLNTNRDTRVYRMDFIVFVF